MQVFVNNVSYELQADSRLNKLPEIIGLSSVLGFAFAVNNTVIPRSEWDYYTLKEGDTVLLIKAFQGG